jgi:hypothetical protein
MYITLPQRSDGFGAQFLHIMRALVFIEESNHSFLFMGIDSMISQVNSKNPLIALQLQAIIHLKILEVKYQAHPIMQMPTQVNHQPLSTIKHQPLSTIKHQPLTTINH